MWQKIVLKKITEILWNDNIIKNQKKFQSPGWSHKTLLSLTFLYHLFYLDAGMGSGLPQFLSFLNKSNEDKPLKKISSASSAVSGVGTSIPRPSIAGSMRSRKASITSQTGMIRVWQKKHFCINPLLCGRKYLIILLTATLHFCLSFYSQSPQKL